MPSDRIFTFCDRLASCTINIFDRSSLPRNWVDHNGKRIFALWLNFVFLTATWSADWIFMTCWSNFRLAINQTTIDPIDPNATHADSSHTELLFDLDRFAYQKQQQETNRLEYQKEINTKNILYSLYLTCLIISTILLPVHIVVHLFAFWRRTWRQTLVLALEFLTLFVEFCAPPILVTILFMSTKICSIPDENGNENFQSCQWRTLTFAAIHAISLFWQAWKMICLGLCCCFCSGCCALTWPVHNFMKKNKRAVTIERRQRPSTLGGTVLNCMPPETDRGSWLNGTKWCVLTSWTCPLLVISLGACAILITIMAGGQNIWYYGGCNN